MAGFKCPFCGEIMSLTTQTVQDDTAYWSNGSFDTFALVKLTYHKCPNPDCGEFTIFATGETTKVAELDQRIWPSFTCNRYPSYVPEVIQKDYQEACAIKDISPKASATLSRRCLQAMIRDFHDLTKNNLHQEIVALKGKVDDDIIDALIALKSIGNIGAHPETDVSLMIDVEPEEAEQMIKLIEFLIDDWYIAREKRQGVIGRLKEIHKEKESEKESASASN